MASPRSDQPLPQPKGRGGVKVASAVIRVSNLGRSLRYYCDVFGFRVTLRESDVALLLSPSGFQLYLNSIDPSRRHDRGTIGVEFLMWATDSREELEAIEQRLREHDPAVFIHVDSGVTFVEGCDPDRTRVVVAYPSPDHLPRQIVAPALRG
ncbi:VOC family protein [Mycolicibacter sp. MYC123]|uniref:VOC family protein n=1 Tax=[Mycobacterium] zoologicum TaxID=2872311 RepID=A0ABU5YLF2_9MYCO|nr:MULTISPECIES: VOC family protein [unclassified Mycolicibacter]MEB3050893.1 VOC family protein [Mycolicibacter sp. MYC123]MEB3061258.1 VOC family protein [Mycolicibacter sp. MYC101]